LVFTILSAVAAFERERTQERILEAKAAQREQKKFLGGSRPFGYTLGPDGELQDEPKEQKAIRLMVKLRDQGKSLRAIAEAVNKKAALNVSHMVVKRVLRAQADLGLAAGHTRNR